VLIAGAAVGTAGDLAAAVHGQCLAVVACERAEVVQFAVVAAQVRAVVAIVHRMAADDLPAIVDIAGRRVLLAEIGQLAVMPPDRIGPAVADHVAVVVDRLRAAVQARQGGHVAVGPQEGIAGAVGGVADADDLAAIVDVRGVAVRPAERAEVGHPATGPQECVLLAGRGGAVADDVTVVVHRLGAAVQAAQRAEIDDSIPRRGARRGIGRRRRRQHDARQHGEEPPNTG
jgi:hypothetical protein